MQSAATDILGKVADIIPRSDAILDESKYSSKLAKRAIAVIKSIDCSEQKYGDTQSLPWCNFPRLCACLCYFPQKYKIYHCARDNCYHGVRALLDHGEDPNQKCPIEDYTALLASVYNDNLSILSLLLSDAKTDLDSPRLSSRGTTALHFAASVGNAGICGLLLWAGANRTKTTTDGKTPLDLSRECGHADAADVLNFDPTKVSISLAAKHGDVRVTKALFLQGVSMNSRRMHYSDTTAKSQLYTPLIAATTYGQFDYIKFLLDQSENNSKSSISMKSLLPSQRETLDINLPNPEGHTALMCAAMMGHERVVLLLLERGKADRDMVDLRHVTAAEWAKRRGYLPVYDILRYDPRRCSIHAFVSSGNMEATVALCKQKVSPNEKYVSPNNSGHGSEIGSLNISMSGVFNGESPLAVAARL